MARPEPAFVPLGQFWSSYFELTSRPAPPPRADGALREYFHSIFGDLTEHRFERLETVPFRVACHSCRNNNPQRNAAVCATHLGVLTGVLQAMTHAPLEAECRVVSPDECSISIDVARVGEVRAEAHARSLPHAALQAGQEAGFMLADSRAGQTYLLSPGDGAIFNCLAEERTAAAIALMTGIEEMYVRAALDRFYAAGWITCRFDAPGMSDASG